MRLAHAVWLATIAVVASAACQTPAPDPPGPDGGYRPIEVGSAAVYMDVSHVSASAGGAGGAGGSGGAGGVGG